MIENKRLLALSLAVATSLTACGGGGDADQNEVRNLFAVGDIVEGVEDGDPVEGDVSTNDLGEGLIFALKQGSITQNGSLEFNDDGTFIYTPNPDFFGTDSVTYVATQSSTGETDTALLTFDIENDFESIEEYGWGLVWSDEFDQTKLDENIWTGVNANITNGHLVITAQDGTTSSLKSVNEISSSRLEASIKLPEGSDLSSVFGLLPMSDIYAGKNSLTALETDADSIIAGAHYGLGLTNGVNFNSESIAAAKTEFHNYAIEWGADQIRWYIDGIHVHTVDPLNTWAYTLSGEEIVVDNTGPFNQNMQITLELLNGSGESGAEMLVDYVKVWSCDPTIEIGVENCASYVNSTINKAASDRIESVGPVTTEVFTNGYFDKNDVKVTDLNPLIWHYTDEIKELSITSFNSPKIETLTIDGEHALVIDVSHPEGDANVGIAVPGIEFIGRDAVLSFDMYIDSANTLTETLDIRMETGWPYMGMLTWNVAELELDSWVTYNIPVSEFVNNPFLAPDWLNWIPGVGAGDALPLDTSNVNALLVVEFYGGVHFQLDNIQLSCISNESCIQGPMAEQVASGPEAPSTIYQAENWDDAGDVQVEDTADEDGGQNVGWIDAGDFLQYTITAPSDGTYSIDYRLASSGGSDGFTVSIDGIEVDAQAVNDTGGWQEWTTQSSSEFSLAAGEHTVRFDFIGGAINFNWFKVIEPVFEIVIEAESFEEAGNVQVEDTADENGGQNVGWIDAGDFLQYTVNIPADGTYNITYRVASSGGSNGFETSIGGVVVDTQTIADTGGWQEWTSQTASIDLIAGEQTLRLDFLGGAININWIKITN
ncbi:carbohydrate-binding protein [Pseudoalteromonas sp. NBT06-2]|uniref:carbohydrate-binding protein n=1 Tax=Pseudoalteromonas sp. NBT06-2 TaxID=2025950 RepID=UPI001483606C|nr:carbohydrate-binding protein [Pseudoalteromonas sp. NBT06-2]